jgi:cysteine synthase B
MNALAGQRFRSTHKRKMARSVGDLVGNTPLLDLSKYSPHSRVRIYAKAEWCNPGGSVKDRPAKRILSTAVRSGQLTGEKILLDASSGNTGLAYALFAAARRYGVRLAVPENVSRYQKNLLRAYGADVVYTSAQEGSDGAIRTAQSIFAEEPEKYFYADQYSNEENWRAHYLGTAPEIWWQTHGTLTHFVAGLGTSGTFTGVARWLRMINPTIRLISVQPDSPFHGLEGLKHMPSALVPAIYDERLADENLEVPSEGSQELVRDLARREGLLVGLSAGGALYAARQVAAEIDHGIIVTVFADGGQRYLEEKFWDK